MKVYGSKTVHEAALDRIRWLFAEFPNVVVGFSGGKDSTVVFNLAMQVARELNRLPLTVMFLDQEAEWAATIEQVQRVMTDPDVRPRWYQMPIRLFNATSTTEHWLYCWDAAAEERWMRPRETYSVHENVYGTDRFGEMFGAIMAHEYKGEKACYIAGVRTEESPTRALALTHNATYKWATWGKRLGTNHFTFYPIYDWSYRDVWKAIHDGGWSYNSIYDVQYQYRVPIRDMRVSNVHHETAVQHLFRMQEIEPQTYERLTQRIAGIDTAGKLGKDDYFAADLPFMFNSWTEYRDYLLDKLITVPEWHDSLGKRFKKMDEMYGNAFGDKLARVHINSILTNDWECIKLDNFERAPDVYEARKRLRGQL